MVTPSTSIDRVYRYLLRHPRKSPIDIARGSKCQVNTAIKDMHLLRQHRGVITDKLRIPHKDKTYHFIYWIVPGMVAI
jgi:hypothetical protein